MSIFDLFGPPPAPLPPWEERPDSYGYILGGQPVVCTRGELERVCAVKPVPRQVWTPETGGLASPEDVPFLLRVLRRRLMGRPLRVAGIVTAIGAFVVGKEVRDTGLTLGSPAALYLAMMLALVALSLHAAWQAARLSPDGFRRMVEQAAESSRVQRRPVVHTPWLAGMMILGGLAQLVALGRAGGLDGVMTYLSGAGYLGVMPAAVSGEGVLLHGEWPRLLSAAFVHGGAIHFAVNFMALMVLGAETEMFAGRGALPLVFLLSVLGGSLLGVYLPPEVPSVGNSGGLVGVIAFMGVLAWKRPGQVPPGFLNSVLINVAVLIGIGVVGYAYVDNAGHAGGGLTGALLGMLLIPSTSRRERWEAGPLLRHAGVVSMAVLAASCAWTVWVVAAQPVAP